MTSDEPDFGMTSFEAADCTVLTVTGELDVATTPDLQAAITDAVARALPVVVDTSGVTFMDSTGLAGLLMIRGDKAAEHRLTLRQPSPAVLRVLELTGLVEVFNLEG